MDYECRTRSLFTLLEMLQCTWLAELGLPRGSTWNGSQSYTGLTCWIPHWFPVQVTVFLPDPSTKPMVKTATMYQDTCKEMTRKAGKPQMNNRNPLVKKVINTSILSIHTSLTTRTSLQEIKRESHESLLSTIVPVCLAAKTQHTNAASYDLPFTSSLKNMISSSSYPI